MYRVKYLEPRMPGILGEVGVAITSRAGIHVFYDDPYYHKVANKATYMKGPVKPFVGMSFAALVYFKEDTSLMNLGLGRNGPILELSQKTNVLDVHSLDSAGGTWKGSNPYDLKVKKGVYVWYEITFHAADTIKLRINGVDVRQFAAIDATFVQRLSHDIRFHQASVQDCTFLEFHWTALQPQHVTTLFDATKRYYINSYHTNKKAIFTGVDACLVSEGGSITMKAKNEERNPSVGMKLGFAKEPSDETRFVTMTSALDKTRNIILIRVGFAEYTFYCNNETRMLPIVTAGKEYLVIRDNCEPYNIDVHCGAKSPAAS